MLGVSAIVGGMTTNKRERGLVDDISSKVLDEVIQQAGMNNSAVDRASKSAIGYNRVRDIRLGLKAPVKLSEFLIICDVCGADPVQTLRDIMAESERLKKEQSMDAIADAIAADPEKFDLAAHTDPNKEAEMETPRE